MIMPELPENSDSPQMGDSCPPSCSTSSDTPETDQLLECDQYKVDDDGAEYSAYRRMCDLARTLERERDEWRKIAVDLHALHKGALKDIKTSTVLHAGHCSLSFEDWWNDHENGCPTLVLDNDEQFARAVWDAAMKQTEKSAGIDSSEKTL